MAHNTVFYKTSSLKEVADIESTAIKVTLKIEEKLEARESKEGGFEYRTTTKNGREVKMRFTKDTEGKGTTKEEVMVCIAPSDGGYWSGQVAGVRALKVLDKEGNCIETTFAVASEPTLKEADYYVGFYTGYKQYIVNEVRLQGGVIRVTRSLMKLEEGKLVPIIIEELPNSFGDSLSHEQLTKLAMSVIASNLQTTIILPNEPVQKSVESEASVSAFIE